MDLFDATDQVAFAGAALQVDGGLRAGNGSEEGLLRMCTGSC